MSQAALLCLLYLVLLTATTIHHYLVADAPNHSILPLIYLSTTPLENSSVHPGMYCVDPPIHLNVQSSIHPWVHLSTHSTCHSSVCPFMLSFIHSSLHPLSIHPFIFCHLSADDPVICQSIQSGSIERAHRQLVAPDKSRLLISWHYAALSQQISAGSSTLAYLTLISKQHAEITRHCVGV